MEIYYTCIIIILIILYRLSTRDCEPEGKNNNKGFGEKNESVSVLIDRIEWANNYFGRLSIFPRFLFHSIVITFALCLIIQNRLPSPLIYTQSIFVTYILLKAFHHFTSHHCDKFSNYAIDRNIKFIREKLKLEKNHNLSKIQYRFPGNSECWNFTYKETY